MCGPASSFPLAFKWSYTTCSFSSANFAFLNIVHWVLCTRHKAKPLSPKVHSNLILPLLFLPGFIVLSSWLWNQSPRVTNIHRLACFLFFGHLPRQFPAPILCCMYYISIESFTGYSTHSMNILFTPSVLAFTFLSSCVSNSLPEQRKPQPLLHWKGLWHSFLMPCPDDFAKVHHLPSPP